MISSSRPCIRLLAILSITVLLAAVLPGCRSTGRKVVSLPPRLSALPGDPNQRQVNKILKTAFSQVGNPYRYGGSSPETGFDCSGFVGWVYGQFGMSLPRSSRDMLAIGVPVDREELRPGDLVFFNYGYSHVGIYTGGDKYIHSPSSGKSVQESSLTDKGRGDRFVGGRRIIDNVGVAAISEGLKREWIANSRNQADSDIKTAMVRKRIGAASLATTAPAKASAKPGSPPKTAAAKPKADAKPQTAAAKPKADAKADAKPKAQVAKPKAKAGSPKVHSVAAGDNLVTLARRYGVTVNDIVAANQLPDRHKLKIGQKLKIPGKGSSQTAKNKSKSDSSGKTASSGAAKI
ncbi:MAG: C40 family peptidase [Deltaproteobacteria bacterium]|jgi:LysM repeat protein|nr:C40 family peptidase [Deltaproteobacteria bacterium]